jgi:hypothetical protein
MSDSRHKTADSVSDSNFKIELPITVNTPDDCVFYITEISIPNVFQTVQENFNDRMYWALGTARIEGVDPPIVVYDFEHYITKIPAGNYTISQFAEVILNVIGSQYFSVAYDDQQYILIITNNTNDKSLVLYSDTTIRALTPYFSDPTKPETYGKQWNLQNTSIPYNANELNSINEILSLTEWICRTITTANCRIRSSSSYKYTQCIYNFA